MRLRPTFALTFLALIVSGCTATRRPPEVEPPQAEPEAHEAYEEKDGPPLRRDDLGPGVKQRSPMPDSLPGTDARVNQDASGQNQNETSIAVSPADTSRVVGAWNDYFIRTAGQNTVIGYGWTSDGGQTWQSNRINFSTLPATQSTGDPVIVADSLGNFYMGILAYSGSANGILVAKSVDGGATWAEPVRLDNGGDKEYLVVDYRNDTVYTVWENTGAAFNQGIFFSKSTNRGVSWSARRQISTNGGGTNNGATPSVGPNGEVYVVWGNFGNTIWFQRSLDAGTTWLPNDRAIRNDVDIPPSPLNGNFRNPPIPSSAADTTAGPWSGRIYVVWGDDRSGDADVLMTWSSDQGNTWSAPVRVNDDVVGNGADQFFPWVHVDGNGHVHVVFLDRREDAGNFLIGTWLATSTDGGQTFGPNIRVSDGTYGPTGFGFLGDYIGSSTGGGKIVPLWPDGRNGNPDVFAVAVDTADYDKDGILNDGNLDGQYANLRCSGQNVLCDDNCPGTPNVDQADGDGDVVGDACDNCPTASNTNQFDQDQDTIGDVCDACPGVIGGDAGDPDLDGRGNCVDNCPTVANTDQANADGDALGDACDPCPLSAANDADGDTVCGDVDNCAVIFNPAQADSDLDGRGDLCDVCPTTSDPGQADGDGDGRGDACDCQPADAGDRRPAEVASLVAQRGASGETLLTWSTAAGVDAYQVTRGTLQSFVSGDYGACAGQGIPGTSFTDPSVPAAEAGYFYLVSGQNFDCGGGSLGTTSAETERSNGNPGACSGVTVTDRAPNAETAVAGTVTGTFANLATSNNVRESIQETISSGGNPGQRYSFLEHRWTIAVAPGTRIELHVEGSRTNAGDGDNFRFEWSTDGTNWTDAALPSLPTTEAGDLQALLPGSLAGVTVQIRVVDTVRSPGTLQLDTVTIDQLWVRSIP